MAGAAMDTVHLQVLGGLIFLAQLGTFHFSHSQRAPHPWPLEEHSFLTLIMAFSSRMERDGS